MTKNETLQVIICLKVKKILPIFIYAHPIIREYMLVYFNKKFKMII